MQWQKVFADAKKSLARLSSRISDVRYTSGYTELNRSVREIGRRGHVSVGLLATSVAGVAAASIIGPADDQGTPDSQATMAEQDAAVVQEEQAPTKSAPQAELEAEEKEVEEQEAKEQEAEAESKAESSGDEIDQWIDEAIEVMRDEGHEVSDENSSQIRTVIEKESGGDPESINLWDSNAVKGTPSKGLMQTIDPTFDSYKMDGHEDIYDPVDNIIAGTLYTIDRYGSMDDHPGVQSMSDGGEYKPY